MGGSYSFPPSYPPQFLFSLRRIALVELRPNTFHVTRNNFSFRAVMILVCFLPSLSFFSLLSFSLSSSVFLAFNLLHQLIRSSYSLLRFNLLPRFLFRGLPAVLFNLHAVVTHCLNFVSELHSLLTTAFHRVLFPARICTGDDSEALLVTTGASDIISCTHRKMLVGTGMPKLSI